MSNSVSTVACSSLASLASAFALGGNSQTVYSNPGAAGGIKLPNIGVDGGCLLGDEITIFNTSPNTITVYASGSATISGYGVSASGNTGVACTTVNGLVMIPISATSWIFCRFGSA
jgi:hypothetical protein